MLLDLVQMLLIMVQMLLNMVQKSSYLFQMSTEISIRYWPQLRSFHYTSTETSDPFWYVHILFDFIQILLKPHALVLMMRKIASNDITRQEKTSGNIQPNVPTRDHEHKVQNHAKTRIGGGLVRSVKGKRQTERCLGLMACKTRVVIVQVIMTPPPEKGIDARVCCT